MEHQEPSGNDCQICLSPCDEESYCEFKVHANSSKWTPSTICFFCLEYLQKQQWELYKENISKVSCRREAIELCSHVPRRVHDKTIFKCPDHNILNDNDDNSTTTQCSNHGEIECVWKYSDNSILDPVLDGAPDDSEYILYSQELLEFANAFIDSPDTNQ